MRKYEIQICQKPKSPLELPAQCSPVTNAVFFAATPFVAPWPLSNQTDFLIIVPLGKKIGKLLFRKQILAQRDDFSFFLQFRFNLLNCFLLTHNIAPVSVKDPMHVEQHKCRHALTPSIGNVHFTEVSTHPRDGE